jgi:membrane-bound lytic murein transglycosylase B
LAFLIRSFTRFAIAVAAAGLLAPAVAAPPASKTPTKKASKAAAKPTKHKAPAQQPNGVPYATRPDVMQAAEDIAQRRDLDPAWVRQALGQAHYLPLVAKLIAPPPVGTPKNWTAYRKRFIEPVRVQAGVRFWQANRDWLAKAEAQFGVPAEIVVGIIGVETIYGQQTGTFRVLDALATLSFDFPSSHPRAKERAAYFKSELELFLSQAQRSGQDPRVALGSFAGAMGLPQFMPSSWSKYALDFDGDGKVDLQGSAADAIGSVAHYFQAYGWKPGVPTHYGLTLDEGRLDLKALLAPDILPTFSAATMADKGVLLDAAGRDYQGTLALVELQNGALPPSYVAGTDNFYVITRYNWSSYYAMAVIELGQAVAAQAK